MPNSDENLIGKRGFSGDPLGRTLPFNNSMDFAKWVKDMTEERPDEDEGNDDGDLDPVSPNNSKFLHA